MIDRDAVVSYQDREDRRMETDFLVALDMEGYLASLTDQYEGIDMEGLKDH